MQYEDHDNTDSYRKSKPKTLGRIVEHCFAHVKKHRILPRSCGKKLDRSNVDPGLAVILHFMRAIQQKIQPLND
jgi:hypothetical protein